MESTGGKSEALMLSTSRYNRSTTVHYNSEDNHVLLLHYIYLTALASLQMYILKTEYN